VFGIDLGTTNSVVAVMNHSEDAAEPRCVRIPQSTNEGTWVDSLVPSVVALYDGKVLVGQGAKRLRARTVDYGLLEGRNLFSESKNDIGIEKTYASAPAGFRTAAEIGGEILKFLVNTAAEESQVEARRIVVTVPASFQISQREDTLKAAKLAGLQLHPGDLLDEPVAAFLDYLHGHREEFEKDVRGPKTLVVFDFGGGTCDVAVFRLTGSDSRTQIGVSPLAVSRYHRLGGGDLDRAIVHDVLIPALILENSIPSHQLDFQMKKRELEPALLGIAEQLKIKVCSEISRQSKLGRSSPAGAASIIVKQPGRHECPAGGSPYVLTNPALSAAKFEELLRPFLDTDLLYARETDYRMTCSIFAPLEDALQRAQIAPGSVDYCLLAGGSSLIPQVKSALAKYFTGARILAHDNAEAAKTTVAKGAALHALALQATGKGLVQPVVHDAISLRTQDGLLELIPAHSPLPFPPGGAYHRLEALRIPKTQLAQDSEVRVEVVIGQEDPRLAYQHIWRVPPPVSLGDRLYVECRMDENQQLDLRLGLVDRPGISQHSAQVQNPVTNVVNPQTERVQIHSMEEDLRANRIPKARIVPTIVALSGLCQKVGQTEKALSYLKHALRINGRPDTHILQRLAQASDALGDYQRAEVFYKESAEVEDWDGGWFNLALHYWKRKNFAAAHSTIEKALLGSDEPAYCVLKGLVLRDSGNTSDGVAEIERGHAKFLPVAELNDFELGWFLTASVAVGDEPGEAAARKAQVERTRARGTTPDPSGELPRMAAEIVRRNS
jgi:molecular chaperone DnaK (HSP70)